MRSGPYCENEPACQGFHYKFDDCQSEAAYVLSLDGSDDEDGSTEFEGHYTLMIVTDPIDVEIEPCTCTPHVTRMSHFGTALYCETEQNAYCNFECECGSRTVTLKRGNYIVQSTDQGFVYLLTYESETAARLDFTAARDRYSEWLDADEDDI